MTALFSVTRNSDGSTNWWALILVLLFSAALPALIRCVRVIQEGEVAVRTRFGRAVISKRTGKAKVVHPGPHFVIFKVHSLKVIGDRVRTTELEVKKLTFSGKNYDISLAIRWRVSPEDDYPYRAMFNVVDPDKNDKSNAQLIEVVEKLCNNAILRYYRSMAASTSRGLPLIDVDDLKQWRDNRDVMLGELLLEQYGVQLEELLYVSDALADEERAKEGMLAIAAALSTAGFPSVPRLFSLDAHDASI